MGYATIAEVRSAFARLELTISLHPHLHQLLNLPEGYELVLSEGSATYGRAYRIHYIDKAAGRTGHSNIRLLDDYLGMTKQDAWSNLTDYVNKIYHLDESYRLGKMEGK